MTAKEYLQQIRDLDDVVKNKLVELYQLRCLATSITAPTDREAVQTSGTTDKVGNMAVKIADFEKKIDKHIDEYLKQKEECIKVIEEVQKVNRARYRLLFMHYVQYIPLVTIAKELNFSYPYVLEIHKAALNDVEKVLKNRKNLCLSY